MWTPVNVKDATKPLSALPIEWELCMVLEMGSSHEKQKPQWSEWQKPHWLLERLGAEVVLHMCLPAQVILCLVVGSAVSRWFIQAAMVSGWLWWSLTIANTTMWRWPAIAATISLVGSNLLPPRMQVPMICQVFLVDLEPCTHHKVLCFSTSEWKRVRSVGSKEEACQAGDEKGTQRDRGRTVRGGDGRYSRRGSSGETSLPSTATQREVAVRWGQVSFAMSSIKGLKEMALQGSVIQTIRNKFFTARVATHWNRLPGVCWSHHLWRCSRDTWI